MAQDRLTRRQRSLARALPGVVPLRKLIPDGYIPEPVRRAFHELQLNPKNEADWKVLGAVLAIHLFDSGKSPGARPWNTTQQLELLFEVHSRIRDSAEPLTDEQVCRMIAKDKKSPRHFRRSPRTVESKGFGLVKQLRKARRQFAANALVRTGLPLAFATGRF
jgi:uncharacterized protein (UPF0147 family)